MIAVTVSRYRSKQMKFGVLLLGLAMAGCAAAFGQTDGFPEQLKAGCATEAECRQLVTQARARQARCHENTIGSIRCSDARADQEIADALLQEKVTAREAAEQAERNKERDLREERDRQERAEQVQQAKDEVAAREKKWADEQEARRLAAEARIAEQRASREKTEAAELERLRLLGAAGRATELRACFKEYDDCSVLLTQLMAAAADDKEKASLVRLDQQLRLQSSQESYTSGSGGSVICRDGSYSPSCSCGGSMRGCCSHHGGVAGCR